MIKRVSASILLGLGFISVIFFRNYRGTLLTHEATYWLIGTICLLAGWVLLRFASFSKENSTKEQLATRIADLKINGEKIKVDLSKCEIKSNDYTEEKEINSNEAFTTSYTNDMKAINIISGNEMDNVRTTNVYQSVIIYKNSRMGKTETFISGIIPTERTTLLFKIASQKTTYIYVDMLDRSKYYFDLEFLSN